MTLLSALTQYLEDRLNSNTDGIVFDLGYIFARDQQDFWRVVDDEENKYKTKKEYYIPGMFGSFTSDANKPLEYKTTNQLSKSGSTSLNFMIPDKRNANYETVLEVLEEFENSLMGDNFTLDVTNRNDETVTYNIEINSFVITHTGATAKYEKEIRSIVGITISIVASLGVYNSSDVEFYLKRSSQDETGYIKIKSTDQTDGTAGTPEASQKSGDQQANASIRDYLYNKRFYVYYPDDSIPQIEKDVILKLIRRSVDDTYDQTESYTLKMVFPDFEIEREMNYMGGKLDIRTGTPLGASFQLIPKEIVSQ